jgi:hypothetical protein
LLNCHGGAWLGSLWHRQPWRMAWHRGLLCAHLSRRLKAEDVQDMLPWIDTALFVVQGRQGLLCAVGLLLAMDVHHVHLDLRQPLRESTGLEVPELLPESSCLRSVTFDWPLGMLRCLHPAGQGPYTVPTASERFLHRLVRECPLGKSLSHLGSSPAFSVEQAGLLRGLGLEPVDARERPWMHGLSPSCFKGAPASTPPPRAPA